MQLNVDALTAAVALIVVASGCFVLGATVTAVVYERALRLNEPQDTKEYDHMMSKLRVVKRED